MSERWIWKGDGEESDVFSDRSKAVKEAAAKFYLSVAEVQALSRDGWIPLGQYTDLWIINRAERNEDF